MKGSDEATFLLQASHHTFAAKSLKFTHARIKHNPHIPVQELIHSYSCISYLNININKQIYVFILYIFDYSYDNLLSVEKDKIVKLRYLSCEVSIYYNILY